MRAKVAWLGIPKPPLFFGFVAMVILIVWEVSTKPRSHIEEFLATALLASQRGATHHAHAKGIDPLQL
jgi:hypothetical protein